MGQTLDRGKIPLMKLSFPSVMFLLFFFITVSSCKTFSSEPSSSSSAEGIFRLHIKNEPELDPTKATGGTNAYLFSNLYRGLTRYEGNGSLIFDQAEKCRSKDFADIRCTLRKEAKWSDGSPVTAAQFVESFQRILSPESHCPVLSLLFSIKNARDVYAGNKKPSELGVRPLSSSELQFELSSPDQEFFEKLSNPLFAPYRKSSTPDKKSYFFNGPYKVIEWQKNHKIRLETNSYYYFGNKDRPPVEVIFLRDDSAAINLYDKGVLNFLWRLTTINIPKYQGRPDFFQIPQSRYDYIGFNMRPGSPFERKDVRKAFAESLNFDEFKKAFFALGAPGCSSMAAPLLAEDRHCLSYSENAKLTDPLKKSIKFYFSQAGGDDIKRSVEWFQGQWQSHLGVKVELHDFEQKSFIDKLKNSPPDAFRKGVPLNRPTCLAGLESFMKDNPDNYTGFNNLRFENLARSFTTRKMSSSERESVCAVATDLLFKEEYVGIPMGRIHFTLLARPEFEGWKLNELDQLDLSNLKYKGAK